MSARFRTPESRTLWMRRIRQTALLLTGVCSPWMSTPSPAVNLLNAVESSESYGPTYEVWHFTKNGLDPDFLSPAKARTVVSAFTNCTERMLRDMNFPYPWWTGLDNRFTVNVFDLDVKNRAGTAWAHKVDLDAPIIMKESDLEIRGLCLHELFHTMQRQYIHGDILGFWIYAQLGGFGVESTASFAQDVVFSDLDTMSTDFAGKAIPLVRQNPGQRLFNRSYDGALFWTYACEQLGTVTNEPDRGIDFFYELWQEIEDLSATPNHNSLFDGLDNVLERHGTSTRQLYSRFGLCNGLHRLGLTNTVAKRLGGEHVVRYIDDVKQYWTIPKHTNATNLPFSKTDFVGPLGTLYVLYDHPGTTPSNTALIAAKASSLLRSDVYVAAINANDTVIDLQRRQSKETVQPYILGPGKQNIEKMLVIASSASDKNTPITIEVVEGDLQAPRILTPTAAHPVTVSHNSFKANVPLRVRLDGPNELKPSGAFSRSIAGMQNHDFDIRIGGVPGLYPNMMYIGGDYFFDTRIKTRTFPLGLHEVEVFLSDTGSNYWDVSHNSVLVTTQQVNHAIVLDRSFSMNAPGAGLKLDAMKQAASFYAATTPVEHGLIVVTFDGNGNECDEDAAILFVDDGSRVSHLAAESDIQGITLGGATSIGDGLWTAMDALDLLSPTSSAIEHITLITDGIENEGRFWSTSDACGTAVMHRVTNSSVVVHGIALGRDADAALVQGIAEATGGQYSYVDVPPLTLARGPAQPPNSLLIQLLTSFLESREEVDQLSRFFTQYGSAVSGQVETVQLTLTDRLVTNGLFVVSWNDTGANPVISLQDTTGAPVTGGQAIITTGQTYHTFRFLDAMAAGDFQLQLTPQADVAWMASFSGQSVDPLDFVFRIGQIGTGGSTGSRQDTVRERFEEGVPIQMLGYIATTNGPMTNVDIEVRITLPDGSIHCGPTLLLDDASQDDGNENDGLYGLVFTETSWASSIGVDRENNPGAPDATNGSYRVDAAATGVDAFGQPFAREYHGSFQVYRRTEGRDTDMDTIPDTWELYYHTDPLNPLDAQIDLDEDGLLNVDEYVRGTDPLNPDSDRGGEADGSEVLLGRCPFDPADDILPPLFEINVVEDTGCIPSHLLLKPDSITIRFPMVPSYSSFAIYRSLDPTNGFTLLTNVVPVTRGDNLFCDTTLPSGTTAFYQLQPLVVGGAYGPRSITLEGTAWADPVPPTGTLDIMPPAAKTDRSTARVHLRATTNVVSYVLSPKPLDGTETPQPFNPILINGASQVIDFVTLDLPATDPGPAYAYAQFITAAGRRSQVLVDVVEIDLLGDHDIDFFDNLTDPDDDDDLVSDDDEIFVYYTNPFNEDTDGDGLSDFDELFVYGTQALVGDGDGDGLSDAEEHLVYGTLPDSIDTDGDGLPDGYEVQHGLNPLLDDGAADDDPDMDGKTTIEEYLTGTDPLDSNSVFRAEISRTGAANVQLTFPTVPPNIYRVWQTDSLTAGLPTTQGVYQAIQTKQMDVDLSVHPDDSNRFYHVEFEAAP